MLDNKHPNLIKKLRKQEYMAKLRPLIDLVLKEMQKTKKEIAISFGISDQRFGKWCRNGVPAKWCQEFSTALHNIIPIEILSPDVYLSESELKLLDFKTNETIVLSRLEKWKSEQSTGT